jgi:hypothetical protein
MTMPHHPHVGASPRGRAPGRTIGASRPARRGVALLAALVALLLLALLAVGTMHVARGDFQRTRDEGGMRRAANAADAGAYDVIRRWAATPHEGQAIGSVLGPDTLAVTGALAEARTTRTSRVHYSVTSAGVAGDSLSRTLARRVVQLALRLAIPDVVLDAALTVRDSVTLSGSAAVVGTDTTLVAWGASCTPGPGVAGVALPDSTRLCDGPCGAGSVSGRVAGLPPLLQDSAAGDSARYRVFGAEHWGTLTRHAAVSLPPAAIVTPTPAIVSGRCDRTRADNWGAPTGVGACATYAPLIWARGDLELRGGEGQGILLVDGDLTLSNGARFSGIVITRDDVRTTGVGGTVLGAVLAGDANVASGDHTQLGGSALVQRSSCAVDRALEWSARLVPVRARAWTALRQ